MSKLNKIQKANFRMLKSTKKEARGRFFQFPEYGVTILYVPSCNGNGHISWVICGIDDVFSKKLGKYEVMKRMFNMGDKLPIGYVDQFVMEELAYMVY